MIWRLSTVLVLLAAAGGSLPAAAKEGPESSSVPSYLKDVPLIPRDVLFGNPDRAAPRISPDGQRLAWLAPVEGVLNVWVAPVGDLQAARPVTSDRQRGVRIYFWAYTGKHLLYLQDVGGNENWHVYRVNVETGEVTDLTPLDDVMARIVAVSHRVPEKILVGLNDRNPELHDLYAIDIASGARRMVAENTGNFTRFVVDDDYNVRFAARMTDEGGTLILQPDGSGGWEDFLTIPFEDTMTTELVGFSKDGQTLYLVDSRGRDTGALETYNLQTGEEKAVASDPRADLSDVLMHPTENTPLAVSFEYTRPEWIVLDPSVADDFQRLEKLGRGAIVVSSQSLDNQLWTVALLADNGPVRYYLYDRKAGEAKFLFVSRQDLEGLPLVPMHPVIIPARDGLKLVSYLSLPPGTDADGDGRPERPVPMVLDVHGGPWARDTWGFDPMHQLWANRGYAVLNVNYRGSTGFGKAFVNAANLEWARKMQDDLVDAVRWAADEKIADPQRVAITGGSYGGYATLVGMTQTPTLFACGVDIVGPSNLVTLLSTIPPYWKPGVQMFRSRVGDYTTEEGREFLEERSPLNFADRIERPLLIGQGANDPRVKQTEADQIVQAMQKKDIPVTYVLYPDEGHGFVRPPNRLSFYAVAEAFLSRFLGGRYEPIGNALDDSSITVPTGAELVPGLAEALKE